MGYAVAKLVEIELELKRKIKEMSGIENSTNNEFISNIKQEFEIQLQSVLEAIEVLKDNEANTIY